MALRRLAYWGAVLGAFAVVVFWAPADEWAACEAAAAEAGAAEWGSTGFSLFPPGYDCLYLGAEDEVVPLDALGWIDLGASVALPLLLLGGLMSVLLRVGVQLRRRRLPDAV